VVRFVLALALLLPACAFSNTSVTLPETAPSGRVKARSPQTVAVRPIVDRRTQARCGMKKNGYDWDTASAFCTTDPATWVTHLVSRELTGAGYTLAADGKADVTVAGELVQLFIEPMIGMTVDIEADVHLRLTVTSRRGLHAERDVYLKMSMDAGMALFDSDFDDAAKRLADLLGADVIVSLVTLLDRYPSL
jgi:hypothetical protein